MLGLALVTLTALAPAQDPGQGAESPSAPEVQRPQAAEAVDPAPASAPTAQGASEAAPETMPAPAPAADASSPPASSTTPPPAGVPGEPAALPSSTPAPDPEARPDPAHRDEAPMGDLLAPSDDEAPDRRPAPRRSAPQSAPGDIGISKDEALRRYYAALYRPANNPVRPVFSVHGGMALLGSPNGDLNGRVGVIEVEAGASWNKFSFGAGAGIWGGGVRLDDAGEVQAPFGVSGLLSLGLGRLGYTKRAILEPRLVYRATWMPLRAGTEDAPPPEAVYMLPHGPELRFDAGFMVSRVRQPRFFHAVGVTLSVQAVVHTVGIDIPAYAVPRIGLVYSFS